MPRRFGAASGAGDHGGDGRPHLVPVTFAVLDDVVVVTVDHKPKRTVDLRRLRNIRETRRSRSWSTTGRGLVDLWWVRVDATAAVADEPPTPAELPRCRALPRLPESARRP